MTLKKFLLKKFPPSKYIDCPVSKDMQELMEQYATQKQLEILDGIGKTISPTVSVANKATHEYLYSKKIDLEKKVKQFL